jgi:diphosphomevalonate decarboxylase
MMNLKKVFGNITPLEWETKWRSPSNIAFVKYWGKKGHQIPANPSLSMTLKECVTETSVRFTPAENLSVELFLDEKKEDKFAAKIHNYLTTISEELPVVKKLSISIRTENTFPHGTGIASSASGLSAFVLCLTDYLYHCAGLEQDQAFFPAASYLSRLASGSACRSVFGGFTTWGEWDSASSSDLFATPFEVHPELSNLRDSILVVSSEEKKVSSTMGHGRMSDHFFAEARYRQARSHFESMVSALKSGDLEVMGDILENEALSLHAMMMTSPFAYTLLRPQTLFAIEMIRNFREETKLPLYFTLDAGPNLHLIYPDSSQDKIQTFINTELRRISELVIHDERGEGPQKC